MTETPATGRCDWAGCRTFAYDIADGWRFCRPHLHEHQRLRGTDVVVTVEKGPLAVAVLPPAPTEWLWAKFSGDLQPAGTFLPILAVLNRHPGRKTMAA